MGAEDESVVGVAGFADVAIGAGDAVRSCTILTRVRSIGGRPVRTLAAAAVREVEILLAARALLRRGLPAGQTALVAVVTLKGGDVGELTLSAGRADCSVQSEAVETFGADSGKAVAALTGEAPLALSLSV